MAYCRTTTAVKGHRAFISIVRASSSMRSIEDTFIHPDVQRILSSITLSSIKGKPEAVSSPQKIKRNRSKILMMTEEEYKKQLKQSFDSAQSRMQPFPVKVPRTDNPSAGTLLRADPEIAGLSPHRHMFVDLSTAHAGKKNLVVVREPQGDLRTATLEERSRLVNIFFPQTQPGRLIKTPALFTDDEKHLHLLLERGQYMYVLKRACIQFDPDDGEFIKIAAQVFDHLSLHRRFESLDATPFFSNLVYYCASSLHSQGTTVTGSQRLCNLLVYLMSHDRLVDTVQVLRICAIVNPNDIQLSLPDVDSTQSAEPALLNVLTTLKDVFTAEQLSELNLSLQSAVDREKSSEKVVAESHSI